MAMHGRRPKGVLGTRTPSAALVSYTVLKTPENGMRIAGKRRVQGDTFEADPRHMAFLLREGVVGVTPAAEHG